MDSPSSAQHVVVSAIVPARNEEAVIAACVESLAQQPEISEIVVVNDQSSDRTAEIVGRFMAGFAARIRLLEAGDPPAGWVGKNNAVTVGARTASGEWLLFTDADAVHAADSVKRALQIAQENEAVLVSFSPEQVMETWYEKSLIPYVYCRLSQFFSYDDVRNPGSAKAAANGQFLLIRRDVYDAVGGHESVAGEVLEDVALAKRVKESKRRIWFGSGQGIVRVRMYRSFAAMWQGWRKNLYLLIGGNPVAFRKEMLLALLPLGIVLLAGIEFTESWIMGLAVLIFGVIAILVAYDGALKRNGYPTKLVFYGIGGRILYAGVLLASFLSHKRGRVRWKGREYPVRTPAASNMGRQP